LEGEDRTTYHDTERNRQARQEPYVLLGLALLHIQGSQAGADCLEVAVGESKDDEVGTLYDVALPIETKDEPLILVLDSQDESDDEKEAQPTEQPHCALVYEELLVAS